MSLIVELIEAVKDVFENQLSDVSLYSYQAAAQAEPPYVVYSLMETELEHAQGGYYLDGGIRFSVWSSDRSISEAADIHDRLVQVFDDLKLNLSSRTVVFMRMTERIAPDSVSGGWGIHIDYKLYYI